VRFAENCALIEKIERAFVEIVRVAKKFAHVPGNYASVPDNFMLRSWILCCLAENCASVHGNSASVQENCATAPENCASVS
jgi:hypothetical protein